MTGKARERRETARATAHLRGRIGSPMDRVLQVESRS
jgi:hypothetical protein